MKASNRFDVVVIGGGPHGITYANWLKRWRPETRVAVVDKRGTPGYKVGESLLATATRSLVANGLSMPVLRRLFGNKAGIRFWWTGPGHDDLHRHVDVVDIEETFQVERRTLEIALQEASRRKGVTLFTGTKVDVRRSDLSGAVKTIVCDGPDGPFTLTCDVVCDASGPASVLGHYFKTYRKAPERHASFQTNAYFAYFRQKDPVPVAHWNEPATRHLCFPGGWMWFINVASWERTPEKNLRDMINQLLDDDARLGDAAPSRRALASQFGAESERIVSIGVVVREDRDDAPGRSVRERFWHHVNRHPAVRTIMDRYELVEDAYDHPGGGFHTFGNMVHDNTQFAGDGWCMVADAAAFVNPLFSPGLNLGSGSCYLAARATVEALNAGDTLRSRFATYERYMTEVYEALLSETDLYHRAFDDATSFEWALLLKLFFGAADVIPRDDVYSEGDPYVHDLLNPAFRDRVDAARAALREGEESGTSPETRAEAARAVIAPFVREVLARPDVRALRIGEYFSNYTADGVRVESKEHRHPAMTFIECPRCGDYRDADLDSCPICGLPSTPSATRRAA